MSIATKTVVKEGVEMTVIEMSTKRWKLIKTCVIIFAGASVLSLLLEYIIPELIKESF